MWHVSFVELNIRTVNIEQHVMQVVVSSFGVQVVIEVVCFR